MLHAYANITITPRQLEHKSESLGGVSARNRARSCAQTDLFAHGDSAERNLSSPPPPSRPQDRESAHRGYGTVGRAWLGSGCVRMVTSRGGWWRWRAPVYRFLEAAAATLSYRRATPAAARRQKRPRELHYIYSESAHIVRGQLSRYELTELRSFCASYAAYQLENVSELLRARDPSAPRAR